MPGVDAEHLARLEFVFAHVASDLQEHLPRATDFLQNEPLSTKEARSQSLAEVHLQLDALLGDHKGVLLTDQALASAELEG